MSYDNNSLISLKQHGSKMDEIKERIEKSVKLLKYRIKQFDEKKLSTDEGNEEYNRLIVKKAVMQKKLDTNKENSLHSLLPKFLRKLKKETLICDRF